MKNSESNIISDEELLKRIDTVSGEFKGQLDDLYKVIGMIVMGRFYGWRVVRLVSTRSLWATATKLFGDPKLLMDAEGKYASKSVGLKIVDDAGKYWEAVRGVYPIQHRKEIL